MGLNIFKKEEEAPQKPSVADKYQISKKTAANAKPAREQAGSVRIAGKSTPKTVTMSKEEKEKIKRREREESDLRDGVAGALLKEHEGYKKLRRLWYVFIVTGLVMIAISYISLQYELRDTGEWNWANYVSVITLIAAYVFIFTAFFLDLGKIRPIRKEVFAKVSRMSLKHVEGIALDYQKKAQVNDKGDK